MDCVITVKHGNTKKQGKFKDSLPRSARVWTGTIKEAIKDWDIFYRAVFNHVKDCNQCDPTEVLQAYWQLRQGPKHNGRTSAGLATLAVKYKKIGADVGLVKKFVINTLDPIIVVKYAHLFNDEELYMILCNQLRYTLKARPNNGWCFNSTTREINEYLEKKSRPFLKAIAHVFEAHLMPPYEDVERLAAVAEVTLS